MPVNFNRLRNKKRDTVIVASAGILVNAVLAVTAIFLILNLQPEFDTPLQIFLSNLLSINLALIFLNILPIPPLDGSKIFFGWIDKTWARKYVQAERQGMAALIVLVAFVPVVERMFGLSSFEMFDPLGWYMYKMFELFLGLFQ